MSGVIWLLTEEEKDEAHFNKTMLRSLWHMIYTNRVDVGKQIGLWQNISEFYEVQVFLNQNMLRSTAKIKVSRLYQWVKSPWVERSFWLAIALLTAEIFSTVWWLNHEVCNVFWCILYRNCPTLIMALTQRAHYNIGEEHSAQGGRMQNRALEKNLICMVLYIYLFREVCNNFWGEKSYLVVNKLIK